MKLAFFILLVFLLVGCVPKVITKKQYDQKCQEAVNLHNTITGSVYYQGSKEGYDYFSFEPAGSISQTARVKEGEIALTKRFPRTGDRINWVVAYPDWLGGTNIIIQSGVTNTKF